MIYRWPDGWEVRLSVDPDRLVRPAGSVGREVTRPLVFVLAGPGRDDRWAVARVEVGKRFVRPWSAGREGWTQPDVPTGEARQRLLGFLVDLGVDRPPSGIGSSLVAQIPNPGNNALQMAGDGISFLPYPRWVDDARWEGRYEEADRFVMKKVGEGQFQSSARSTDLFLGCIGRLQILTPESYPPRLWHSLCTGQTGDPESRHFHGLVDLLLDTELVLPASSRRAWEAEYVRFGRWVVPGPDEVEVFRALGEPLPWLWPNEQAMDWFRSLP